MSRSGYYEECDDPWLMIKWRGQVASATRGRRGQRLLKDLLAAMDAMPVKTLIKDDLITKDGEVCALGAVGRLRGLQIDIMDPDDPITIAGAFDIAIPLAREIAYINDEYGPGAETPEERFWRVRRWAEAQIKS